MKQPLFLSIKDIHKSLLISLDKSLGMRTIIITYLISCFCTTINSQNIFFDSAFKIDNAETGINYLYEDDELDGSLFFSHKEEVPMFNDHIPADGVDVSIYDIGLDYIEYGFSMDGGEDDVVMFTASENEETGSAIIIANTGKSLSVFNEEEVLVNFSFEDSLNTVILHASVNDVNYALISANENVLYKTASYGNSFLISGSFRDSMVYTAPDGTVSTFKNNSTYNGFLLSIDEFANVEWVHLSPTIGYNLIRTIAITKDNIIFPHDVIFGTQFTLLDFDGNTISSEYLQGVAMLDIDVDLENNIAICGNYYSTGGTADMDFGSGELILPTADEKDAFLIMYDDQLNLIWSQVIGGKEIDTATNFDFDDDGGIYLTGCIQSDGIFDGGSEIFEADGLEDIFISHYNSDGQYDWSHIFGGGGTDIGLNVVASEGSVVLSSIFRQSMDINPSDSLTFMLEDTNDEYDQAFFYVEFSEELESDIKHIAANNINLSPNPTSDKGVYLIMAKNKQGDIFNDMVLKW